MWWPSSPRLASPFFVYGAVVLIVAALVVKEAESRLPPKLLKVASGAGKALYARGYGYNVIPIPQKILLQANFARREVHGPRPPRRNKRPPRKNKRPQLGYASKYHDYRPGRKRRPLVYTDPPEYHEQEFDEEFDYEEHPDKEYEDFLSKHADLYANGYSTRTKPRRHRDEIVAYSENSESVYVRKPLKRRRPSTKLYSATIGSRPERLKQESDYDDEQDENNYYSKGNKRKRYRNNDNYRETDEEDTRQPFKKYQPVNWNPDDIYHDRKYEANHDKFRRVVGGSNGRKRQHTIVRNDRAKLRKGIDGEEIIGQNWSPPPESSGWRDNSFPYRFKRVEEQNIWNRWKPDYSHGSLRWNEPEPVSEGHWLNGKKVKVDEEQKELDIITSQNAGKWEGGRTTESPQEAQKEDWVKEHSVGYGIEIDNGQKKRLDSDPDVVYGQAGNSKPRVPDLGYDQQGYAKSNTPDIGLGQGLEMIEEVRPG